MTEASCHTLAACSSQQKSTSRIRAMSTYCIYEAPVANLVVKRVRLKYLPGLLNHPLRLDSIAIKILFGLSLRKLDVETDQSVFSSEYGHDASHV